VNLYAYAGNDPVSFSDPFGLDSVTGNRAAYEAGKASMQACAAGTNCSKALAAAAAAGLAVLSEAEASSTINIHLMIGSLKGRPAAGKFYHGGADITLDPSDPSYGVNYTLPAVAVHEVHEAYQRLQASGGKDNPAVLGTVYPTVHAAAVHQAEDPVYATQGLPTRTTRSPDGDIERRPCPFSSPNCR
jgi:hypothetical protein